MLFPTGLLGDTIGPKRVIVLGGIVSSLSNMAFSFLDPSGSNFQRKHRRSFSKSIGREKATGLMTYYTKLRRNRKSIL